MVQWCNRESPCGQIIEPGTPVIKLIIICNTLYMCTIEKGPYYLAPLKKTGPVSQPASKQTTTRVCCIAAICASHIHRVFSFPPLYKKFYSSTDELLLCFGCLRWFSLLRFALTWPFIQTASQPSIRWVLFGSVQFSWIQFSSECSEYPYTVEISCSVLRCLYSWISSLAGRLCLSSLCLVWPVV